MAAAVERPRRRLAPDARRGELVEAAVRVLRGGGGEERNWVAEVTREAGVAKGTFYVHFRSWEEMLATVREHLVEECSVPFRDALASRKEVDWWGVLEQQCASFIDMALEFGDHHGLIFHSSLPEVSAERPGVGIELLAAGIAQGVADGCFDAVDTDAAAVMLYGAVHAVADAVLAGGERERWIGACIQLAHKYLAPSSTTTARPVKRTETRRRK
jgi:AcrR family transcriptional regulator